MHCGCMRKSAAGKLTLVPMLAASALAYAQAPGQTDPLTADPPPMSAPGQLETAPDVPSADAHHLPLDWIDGAPGYIEPVMSPPGMTPTIDELTCDEDPNYELRNDCGGDDDGDVGGGGYSGGYWVGGVYRAGYGHYFGTGGG
jgi:hypothetical protein